MRNLKNYKLLSLMLALVYVLSACSGVPGSGGINANVNDSEPVVTFMGVVESMGAGQWTINGQAVNVTGTTSVDANIAVGDMVKVEAVIDQGGVPTAVKIEFSGDDNVNSNDDNGNDGNANDDNSNDDNANDDNTNGNTNGNDNSSGDEIEVIGILDAITTDSLTIDGVAYQIDSFTEFKDEIVVGDQVKAHVIVNADGTLTVREIEKLGGDDNANGSDDNSNSNGNSNDDNGNDDNSNDDNGNDDNGNNDNSNDDDNSDDDNDNGDDDSNDND